MSSSPPPPEQHVIYVEKRGNGLAVAGFVCSVVGAVMGLIPLLFIFALVLGTLGLVFSAIGWRSASREPARGKKGLAVAGTILGVLALVLAVIGVAIIDDAADDLDRELDDLQRELDGGSIAKGIVFAVRVGAAAIRAFA